MNRFVYKTVADVLILCVFLTVFGLAYRVNGSVAFLPSSTSVTVGTNWHFSTDVRIQATTGNPGAFQVMIIYDPNVLRIVQITPNPTSAFAGNIFYDTGSFDSGYTRIVATQTSHSSDVLDQSVFSIEWAAVGESGQASEIIWQVESLIDYWWRPINYANGLTSVGINTADTNNNAIPDWWEIQMTGSTTNLTATDVNKFIAGIDPIAPASFPGLQIAKAGMNVVLSCNASADRVYNFASSLSGPTGPWSYLTNVLTSQSGTISITDTLTRTNRFYRFTVDLPVSGNYLQSHTNAYWTGAPLTDFTTLGAVISPLRPSNLYTLTALNQVSSGLYCFTFDLGNGNDTSGGRWAGVFISPLQPPFNGSTQDIVLGLSATGTTRVKLEAEDINGIKATVVLSDISAIERRYMITRSALTNAGGAGFAVTAIRSLAVVADDTVVGWNKANGNVTLHLLGVTNDMPVVLTGTTYNATLLTSLTNYYPVVLSGGGNTTNRPDGVLVLTTLPQENGFKYEFNVWDNDTCFTYAAASPGFFDNGGVFQGIPMDLSSGYTFAAKGDLGARVKVEIYDVNQRGVTALVELSSDFRNYKLDFGLLRHSRLFDDTKIAEIKFVEDWTIGAPRLSDSVQIKTPGLDFY